MRRTLAGYGVVLGVAAMAVGLTGCGGTTPQADRPSTGKGAVEVTAQRDVLVSAWPLGDVMTGGIHAGDSVTVECFVEGARTPTGATGSAVKVRHGRLVGYAAVTTFPASGKREMVFDADEGTLRARLPSCPGARPGGQPEGLSTSR